MTGFLRNISYSALVISAGAFLAGVLINFILINSTAEFLSFYDAKYMIAVVMGSMLSYLLVAQVARVERRRIAAFGIAGALLCTAGLGLVFFLEAGYAAGVWLYIAFFGRVFYKFIVSELAVRYLNPVAVQDQAVASNFLYEVGTFIVAMIIVFFPHVLSVQGAKIASLGLTMFYGAFLFSAFIAPKVSEIQFSRKIVKKQELGFITKERKKAVLIFVVLSAALLGTLETLAEYTTKMGIRYFFTDGEKIRHILAMVFAASSFCLFFVYLLIGKAKNLFRPSPFVFHALFLTLSIVTAALVWVFFTPWMIVAAAIAFTVLLKGFQQFGTQMIFSFFPKAMRPGMNAFFHVSYWLLPNLIFILLVSSSFWPPAGVELGRGLLVAYIVCAALTAELAYDIRHRIARLFFGLFTGGSKEEAVLAADALSYFKPLNFIDVLKGKLSENPKTLLKSTIVSSLGHTGGDAVVATLVEAFRTSNENVQLAILESLRDGGTYMGIEFLIEVVIKKNMELSNRVKITAFQKLAEIYGRKSIPILLTAMNRADGADDRDIANIIEVLGWFYDRHLIDIVLPYAESPVPRIRANTIIALSQYAACRDLCNTGLRAMLDAQDPNTVAAALYALGSAKGSFGEAFLDEAQKRFADSQSEMIRRCCGWYLVQRNVETGFSYFADVLSQVDDPEFLRRLHFFTQIPLNKRLRVIDMFLEKFAADAVLCGKVYLGLKKSAYDLHIELDVLSTHVAFA